MGGLYYKSLRAKLNISEPPTIPRTSNNWVYKPINYRTAAHFPALNPRSPMVYHHDSIDMAIYSGCVLGFCSTTVCSVEVHQI